MATKKATYQYDNGSSWDEIMFKTTADQVVESSTKRFVSDTEKSKWNGKADASHSHSYLPLSGGTLTGALKFGRAMISNSTMDDTIIINGMKSADFGGIKLGNGGCRIYGSGSTTKLYIEGGLYTNGDIEAANGYVKGITNLWGKSNEIIVEPKRGSGFEGGASFNWTGATAVGSPRYQLTPTHTTDLRVGSPERPIHGVHGKNSYVTTSDRRAKENIVYIDDNQLQISTKDIKDILTKEDFYNFFKDEIKFTYYDMKGGNIENLETNLGFIAQDIANTKVGSKIVIPPIEKITYHNEDGTIYEEEVEDGMYSFSTGNFATATAIALQNAIEEIETLKEIVNKLTNEIDILKNNK